MSDKSDIPLMYAGPGLLRSGTTLSVNPNLKLQTLQVRDKISVPTPLDVTDATNKRYVDEATSKSFYTIGDGLKIGDDARSISLQDDLVVRSLKLTGQIGSDSSFVVTKGYVDNATKPLATLSYVQDNMKGNVKTDDLVEAIEPLATRTYVSTFLDQFALKDSLDAAVKPLALSENVQSALNDKANISYVQNEIATCVKKNAIDDYFTPYAEKAYVDNSVSEFVAKDDIYKQIQSSADLINANIVTQIEDAIQPLATKNYVDETAKNTFSTVYVDKAIEPLATKALVDDLVAGLAEETYVDDAVSSLAPKTYVDDAVEEVANKVSIYVDKSISAASFPVVYPIQHSVPENDDTIESDGKTLLIIDPQTSLETLTITFPTEVEDGKYLVITTTRDISEVRYDNLLLAGDIKMASEPYLAGTTRKFVFSVDAKAWCTLQT